MRLRHCLSEPPDFLARSARACEEDYADFADAIKRARSARACEEPEFLHRSARTREGETGLTWGGVSGSMNCAQGLPEF